LELSDYGTILRKFGLQTENTRHTSLNVYITHSNALEELSLLGYDDVALGL